MKLADTRDNYQFNTGKTSDIVRQLCFAGLALVWIFKTGDSSHLVVPPPLVFPSFVFIAALTLDLLQYFLNSIIWGLYNRHHEKISLDQEREFTAPTIINLPANVF